MLEKPFKIFVVDDDPLLRMVIVDQLQGNNYQIHEFENGVSCLAAMDAEPNLILLDIEMPGENGLDICKEIRARGYEDVQVVFVSAHNDLDTLLAAFDVGGNDFVPKNAEQDILQRKVETAIEAEAQKRQLKQQLNYAQKTAFTAMSSLGETGMVLQFLRESFKCISLQHLGNLLTETITKFECEGLVMLSYEAEEAYFSSSGVFTALEKSIISYVTKMGHIYQNGERLVLNYPHVTILITGLDVEDTDGIGRLRDHMAIIAEGTGVRIEAMAIEQQRLRDANARIEDVKELADLLSEIERMQFTNHKMLQNLAEEHHEAMEDAFMKLGLTDSQEHLLHGIVDRLTNHLTELFESDSRLAVRLQHILDKQRTLLKAQ